MLRLISKLCFAGYEVLILKIESVDEPFDEAPELMLKCLHYVLIIGVKNMELEMDDFWTSAMPFETVPNQIDLKVQTPTNLELNQTFQRYICFMFLEFDIISSPDPTTNSKFRCPIILMISRKNVIG